MAGAISLESEFATFEERWSPKIVASSNGHDVMVVKWRANSSGMPNTGDTLTAAQKIAI